VVRSILKSAAASEIIKMSYIVFIQFMLLSFLSIHCLSSASPISSPYIILLDAGSSGTRIHVHTYQYTQQLAKINPSESMKVKPGK
jgi:hypothetical protein